MAVTRRTLIQALAANSGATATVLAACGTADPGAGPAAQRKEPVTIDWFNTGDSVSDETQKMANTFREKHPNVTPAVSLGGQNNDTGYRAKLKTLAVAVVEPRGLFSCQ